MPGCIAWEEATEPLDFVGFLYESCRTESISPPFRPCAANTYLSIPQYITLRGPMVDGLETMGYSTDRSVELELFCASEPLGSAPEV